MSPVQWTDKTSPDLLAGEPHLIWEQEAAGSNPAIPTRSEHMSILTQVRLGANWEPCATVRACASPVDHGHLSSGSRATVCGRGSGRWATVVPVGPRHSVVVPGF